MFRDPKFSSNLHWTRGSGMADGDSLVAEIDTWKDPGIISNSRSGAAQGTGANTNGEAISEGDRAQGAALGRRGRVDSDGGNAGRHGRTSTGASVKPGVRCPSVQSPRIERIGMAGADCKDDSLSQRTDRGRRGWFACARRTGRQELVEYRCGSEKTTIVRDQSYQPSPVTTALGVDERP